MAESVADQEFGAGGRTGERQLHELSIAFRFLAMRAGGAHPHVGGSAAANCAAQGMPPMGEHASTCSAVDRNKKQPNVGRSLRIAAGRRQPRPIARWRGWCLRAGVNKPKWVLSGAVGSTDCGCWGRV